MKRDLKAIIFDFDGTLAKLNIDFHLMRKTLIDLISSYACQPRNFSPACPRDDRSGRQWLVEKDGEPIADYVRKNRRSFAT